MRLFVALKIDPGIHARIAGFRNQLRRLAPDVRWVGPETFHVTLQFLGETMHLEDIRAALAGVTCAPVEISFRGVGFFPGPTAPRVFWVGVEGDEKLQTLATKVARATQRLGFGHEGGPYTPHLTLARSGSGGQRPVRREQAAPSLLCIVDELARLPSPDFGTMTAHEFYLYESHLSAAGPRYEQLSRFPLR